MLSWQTSGHLARGHHCTKMGSTGRAQLWGCRHCKALVVHPGDGEWLPSFWAVLRAPPRARSNTASAGPVRRLYQALGTGTGTTTEYHGSAGLGPGQGPVPVPVPVHVPVPRLLSKSAKPDRERRPKREAKPTLSRRNRHSWGSWWWRSSRVDVAWPPSRRRR